MSAAIATAAASVIDAAKILFRAADREERRDVQAVALLIGLAAEMVAKGLVTTRMLSEIYGVVLADWAAADIAAANVSGTTAGGAR